MADVKVKMRTRACGPEFQAAPGQVVSVSAAFAKNLVEAGSAVRVEDTDLQKSEKAEAKPKGSKATNNK